MKFDWSEYFNLAQELAAIPSDNRELRNKADYADTMFSLQKDVKYALKITENIILALSDLKQDTES
ncbi:hypothetical protein [Tychonema sp. BBK16]|uniref:hypothetical protein n=1 Tax=Tychonema sp. BBK16 TaxID=2699888 RepID=UPI001F24991C|nr:hypothetical protein [Tychonema sp. BBK16]MCF6375353.1 hypothetical protein [Tychonema sp. BBK16]